MIWFNGVKSYEMLKLHLSKTTGSNFSAALVRIMSRARPFIVEQFKYVLLHTARSLLLSRFASYFRARCTGHDDTTTPENS